MSLFEQILAARALTGQAREKYLNPDYSQGHDPLLLPDMKRAVKRLIAAREAQEHITIYGDYDIDGLTATTVLTDTFSAFGFRFVDAFLPNRFVEGYGMTVDAVERIAKTGTTLIVTVDCGSLSEGPIARAKELGVDVIVTDHHNVAPVQPPAVAVINPKRLLQDHPKSYDANLRLIAKSKTLYPFLDLPGVGVAFKLVQALQTRLDGLPFGQEKWLLDLVALGTVCDVVRLVDENRMHAYFGLKVMAKTRRPGLKALMAVSGVEPSQVNARSLGFALGPRMNASGRLETAQYALSMLTATSGNEALEFAQQLDEMNIERRRQQDEIYKDAVVQAAEFEHDAVLVVSGKSWNHGIVGIVAAKLLELYQKPTYVLQEMGEESKGSARSFGAFSVADAIRASDDIITKGGGHNLAAGVSLPTANIAQFRTRVNEHFTSSGLILAQERTALLPKEDATIQDFQEVNQALISDLNQMEPFGHANPEPVLCITNARVTNVRRMGAEGQHVKLTLADMAGKALQVIAFNVRPEYTVELGDDVRVWFQPTLNEWRGVRSVEGRLVHLERA